jgi:CheY-like chemotaxis protein
MILTPSEILAARVLIVDDQPANVTLLERLLGESGYSQVSSTMRPQEVLALHARNDYDLILLDLNMPGMDGFEVMEALKAATKADYLSVIVLTAQPAHKLRALQAGARDFISKPFDLLEVSTRIRNMLEVRLLHRKLEGYADLLEQTVQTRTTELRESEYRYRRLSELASDWYWEQNVEGDFTRVYGPVLEMLGLEVSVFLAQSGQAHVAGWNSEERSQLRSMIAARQPFLDFAFSRTNANGSTQQFRVSGEPMFTENCQFAGYRGVGVEILDSR